ncbi:uncharacterized protein DNG_02733 [Cephalotrichum gorgonifer]|uniref:RING-type domain-containing protein n=1 Tax=Cephalotrichum gorgonifer TaxID=2041049 RepID=A0AAE8MTQ7_9PEZI|nr:uncharacterized protein DNG_02733 [Cephalotrichum gorgonifer]
MELHSEPVAATGDLLPTTDSFSFVAKPPQELLRQITDLFPDICPAHLDKLSREKSHVPESIVEAILQEIENGVSYPKRSALGKRKRSSDPILDILSKPDDEFNESDVTRLNEHFLSPSWKEHVSKIKGYRNSCVNILASEVFRSAPRYVVKKCFAAAQKPPLFQVYKQVAEDGYMDATAPVAGPMGYSYQTRQAGQTENLMSESTTDDGTGSIRKELHAARRISAFRGRKAYEDRRELTNQELAKATGTMRDCGCCFSDFPMNRMISCNADSEHLFCYPCARKNAEVQLGLSKYELKCLSMDDCSGHFYASARGLFLDKKTISALDRLEQDAALQAANIENLATCPFCPYAAECPPAEEDREFRCENADCKVVSCRLCRRETHIPKTCEEAAMDNKVSARHQIEEAMSAAMIRKCNKCSTPFVKMSGCNKMTCTKPGCGNQQCYICGESCDYQHFTKKGCPLHDSNESVEARHRRETEAAQEAARKRVMEDDPEISEEELRIHLPEDLTNTSTKADTGARAEIQRHIMRLRQAHMTMPSPHQYVPMPPVGPFQWQLPRQLIHPGQHGAQPQEPRQAVQYLHQLAAPEIQGQALGEYGQARPPVYVFGQDMPIHQEALPDHARGVINPHSQHHYAANGRTAPSATAAQVPSQRKAPKINWDKLPSKYSAQLRQRIELVLQPYVKEIEQQVSNHIRGAWVHLPQRNVGKLIREEMHLRIPSLVNSELEDIDDKVRRTPWEKLYDVKGGMFPGQGLQGEVPPQIRHHGDIPEPETIDEYVALHEIIRSWDRRAPAHHEHLAHQTHAAVMGRLGQRQPSPRVAPYHHYGHPDRGPSRGQPSLAGRIQAYITKRHARMNGGEKGGDGQQAPVRNDGAAGGISNQTQATPAAGRVKGANDASRQGGSQSGTPIRLLGKLTENRAASSPIKQCGGNRGVGSREAPILLDDEDSEEGSEASDVDSQDGPQLRNRPDLGVRVAGHEPPRKRRRDLD